MAIQHQLAAHPLFFRMFQHIPIGMAILSETGTWLQTNPVLQQWLGCTGEELHNRTLFEYTHPEETESLYMLLLQLRMNPASDMSREPLLIHYRYIHKNGQEELFRILAVKETIGPENSNVLVLTFDKQKQTESPFAKSEEQYRELIEELPVAFLIQQECRWVYANEAAVRLLDASDKSQILGMDVFGFIHSDFHDLLQERMKLIREGELVPPLKQKFITVTGQLVDVEVSACPFQYEEQFAIFIILRDISESQKAQELLQASEKLSLVGQLAAAFAHEIRNPLTAVKGFISLIQSSGGTKPHYYDIITSEITRMEQILSEMLLLAKPQAARFMPCDIRVLLAHVTTLIEMQAVINRVEFATEYESGIPNLECDENQMKQVFINLLKNSVEAMPGGGRVRIEVGTKGFDHIVVRIIDEGCGIPKDKLPRVGQPFFTTKEKGTGLGMMVTFRIIENHRGTVHIASEEGKGTTVEITLPVSAQSA